MALDLVSFASVLKEHYTALEIKSMSYSNHPLLAMLPKMENFTGLNLPVPVRFGTPASRSVDFPTALAQKPGANSQYVRFVLTRARDYGLATIQNEVLKASKGDVGAFMEAVTSEIDGVFQSVGRSLAQKIYGTGTGQIGVVNAAGAAALTITLATPADVTNFEVGDTIVASVAAGGVLYPGSVVLTGIDRDLGTLTVVGGNWNAQIPGLVATDFLYKQGDAANGGANVSLTGLGGWLPPAAPGAGLFFGVNRTADVTRLGGVRFAGVTMTVQEALTGGATRLGREGGRPSHVFLNHLHYNELLNDLGSRVEYERGNGSGDMADISFSGMRLHTPTGSVLVIPDHNCPVGTAFMLQMDTWKLYSLGAAPQLLDSDGMQFLREAGLDAIEVRTGYYAQLGCAAPGWNANISLAV